MNLLWDGRPVGLTEARNQSWKPQGPIGLLRVHWVSLWVRFLQTIDGIRNQLNHMYTYLCHDGMTSLGERAPCRTDRGP
ncbi:hypothetical protein HKD37_19G053275 [Glycine soja]